MGAEIRGIPAGSLTSRICVREIVKTDCDQVIEPVSSLSARLGHPREIKEWRPGAAGYREYLNPQPLCVKRLQQLPSWWWSIAELLQSKIAVVIPTSWSATLKKVRESNKSTELSGTSSWTRDGETPGDANYLSVVI